MSQPDEPRTLPSIQQPLDDGVLPVGARVLRYIIVGPIGAGTGGIVYEAYDPNLDRAVALKMIPPEADPAAAQIRAQRLLDEAKSAARLSHPNVVTVHDVGVFQDGVYLAMECLRGGTLRNWMASPRPVRAVLDMLIQVGRGLKAAHAAGLIHRDFKPENVLLNREGRPHVADFGLARPADANAGTHAKPGVRPSSQLNTRLTASDVLVGTPAYMAPEQFRGAPADQRSDQFAFAVVLYEALYGVRPFAGDDVINLTKSVSEGRIPAAPAGSQVPTWLRRIVLRGLRHDPAERFPSMDAMLTALGHDPAARRRRVLVSMASVVAIGAVLIGIERAAERRRRDYEGKIAARLTEGLTAVDQARQQGQQAAALRARAFAAFDQNLRDEGERAWGDARAATEALDATLERAQTALESTLALDKDRGDARDALAEVVYQRALVAESEYRRDDVRRYLHQLGEVDGSGRMAGRWATPGRLTLRTIPGGASVAVERYDEVRGDRVARLANVPLSGALSSPVVGHALAPGSYRLTVSKDGYTDTLFPLVVERGQEAAAEIRLVPTDQIPAGFAYVPAGSFLYGDVDEDWRVAFLNTVPIHRRRTGGYFIKRQETTFGEWLAFLATLSPRDRAAMRPASAAVQGAVSVYEQGAGRWIIELKASGKTVSASSTERLVYAKRERNDRQDWSRMPVIGISPKEMEAYAAWLATSGRVPRARLCSELEWERAARGADERVYPASAKRLNAADANVDATYGRVPGAYGPDEVGLHPESRSPFGLDDMTGNVWEVVRNNGGDGGLIMRGGSYYQASTSGRLTNREPVDADTRSFIVGLRLCADVGESQ